MRSIILIFATTLIIAGTFLIDISGKKEQVPAAGKYTIVIHGGAGTISKSIPDS